MYCSRFSASASVGVAAEAVARVVQQSGFLSPLEVAQLNSRLRQASHSAREFAASVFRLVANIAIEINPHLWIPVIPEIVDTTYSPSYCISVSSEHSPRQPIESEDVWEKCFLADECRQ